MRGRGPGTGGEWPRLVGMVHLGPLPGAPRYGGSLEAVLEAARRDARALAEAGFEALMVENFGDVPFYPDAVPPETVAAMTAAVLAVGQAAPGMPLGVNVLRNDARAALAVAAATGAAFVRVNVHAGAAVADQGLLVGRAHETLRARASLCPGTRILADVRVKHARPLGEAPAAADECRELVGRALADGLVVSGIATGAPPDLAMLAAAAGAGTGAPVFVGSGATAETVPELLRLAWGVIAGTSLKAGGDVRAPVDPDRARRFVEAAAPSRGASFKSP